MRLTINILHLAKADKLIFDNAFLSKYLEQDNNGGWFVNTDNNEHLNEIKRLLDKNNIKYKIELKINH